MQSKKHSLIESVTQNIVGYLIGLGSQYIIFPLFNIEINLIDNLLIGALFAIISTLRSYIIRRLFNWSNKNEI